MFGGALILALLPFIGIVRSQQPVITTAPQTTTAPAASTAPCFVGATTVANFSIPLCVCDNEGANQTQSIHAGLSTSHYTTTIFSTAIVTGTEYYCTDGNSTLGSSTKAPFTQCDLVEYPAVSNSAMVLEESVGCECNGPTMKPISSSAITLGSITAPVLWCEGDVQGMTLNATT